MRLFMQHTIERMTNLWRGSRSARRRFRALALTLVLLLELSGTAPSVLFEPLLTKVSAESGFTYQPGSMGLAMLPRDDVFSLSKLRKLEEENPSVVLNINDRFSLTSAHNVLHKGKPAISDTLTGMGSWSANYRWNPKQSASTVVDHLLNKAGDLEVLWSGSYTRSDSANPSAEVWYYGNEDYLLIYAHSYDTLRVGRGPFVEKRGGAFSAGVAGAVKSGATDGVPLLYNRISEGYQWTIRFDSKGRPVYEKEWDATKNRYVTTDRPVWDQIPFKNYYPTVAGERLRIKPLMEKASSNGTYEMRWEDTAVNVTLSGMSGTSISDTKIRLRDNAAPFLNSITLRKNGDPVKGDAYMKDGDALDIVLTFNEDIRFADNTDSDHDLKLRLSFVDKSNGVSDSDSWIEADLVGLAGQSMIFRFDPKGGSRSGKTLPDEFYLDSISGAAQKGWFSDEESFPLSLVDASGRTVVTGASCCGVITDLAGNPFEKFNVTRFEGDAKAHYDVLGPSLYKTSIWTTNLSAAEASTDNNSNEIDPDKLFLKIGDSVNLKVIFSEELNAVYKDWRVGYALLDNSGGEITPTATLNVRKNGAPVTLAPQYITTIDSKSIDVNAPARLLTVVEYQQLIITGDMTLDGDAIQIASIEGLSELCDKSLNAMGSDRIPRTPFEQRLDIDPPEIEIGASVDDTLDMDVFTVPIRLADAASGLDGQPIRFRLTNSSNEGRSYLWMVDGNATIVRREDDEKTADTSGWAVGSAVTGKAQNDGWETVVPPIGVSGLYLHIKLIKPEQWDYALSDVAGENDETFLTVASCGMEVKIADIKGNEAEESATFIHAIGQTSESVISLGGVAYGDGKATIPVTVTNPVGVQRIVWGTSVDAMTNVAHTGELVDSHSFDAQFDTSNAGIVTLYVGAYGPSGAVSVNSVSYSYDFSAGTLSYSTDLGEEKKPLFGLPEITDMLVTGGNRTMVLLDRGDGRFYATNALASGNTNLFAPNSGLSWFSLTGTVNADYSALTVTGSSPASAGDVAAWLTGYYGKVTIVLLNQDVNIVNGDGGWGSAPGSYDATDPSKAIASAVEYAYLANGASFDVTAGVVNSLTGYAVSPEVLSGAPDEPHSDLSDYTFIAELKNETDEDSNQFYGLRTVESAEAELYHSSDGTNYESVRKVELSVGSTTKLCFTKADSEASGWYRVVYRYTVNGQTEQVTLADGVYLDSTAAITPDVVCYDRSFDLWVREPMWKYAAYFIVDRSFYSHSSIASDEDIEDGEIVKIGVAPIEVPEDRMTEEVARFSLSIPGVDEQQLDRYYLTDNEVNELTFRFEQTDPEAGSASISRIGGTNIFYAWSGNDPCGRENARNNAQTFAVGDEVTLTVTDGTEGFDYADGSLPLTDGYNLVHYVVEYMNGETVEKSFMADVRAKAMDLGLDVYYHAADRYLDQEQVDESWETFRDLTDEGGKALYASKTDYLNSLGAVSTNVVTGVDESGAPITEERYVIVGAKCTDEADLYHRNEAVVNPVLNDYDAARASSFTSYRHLDGEIDERTLPETPKLDPMGEERFRKSSEHELFFAEDVYGNVSFASLGMDAIDGEAPTISYSSSFADNAFGDIVRNTGYDESEQAFLYGGFDFLLNIHDDNPLDLSSLSVSFDPAYSKVLDPTMDGMYDRLTMDLPLNLEQDEYGYFKPWELPESEAGKTGGITMTCLKMDLNANPDSPEYRSINGVEIQGAFKPCELADNVTMTFTLIDAYGNTGSYQMVFYNHDRDPRYDNLYGISSQSYALCEGARDNSGWYNAWIEQDTDRNPIDWYFPAFHELPDWVSEPEYYTNSYENDQGETVNVKYGVTEEWRSSVIDLLPELDYESPFTNEGYLKFSVIPADQREDDFRTYLPYALSVESYQTDYGVFTDGYVRTRNFDKLTGRFGSSASSYQTEQAIILPSVTENGSVTVNWTDVFGEPHTDTVTVTAFGGGEEDEMTVRGTFSPATRTNEDVLVTLKGSRLKDESGTKTCEITGITVTLHDENGTTFDETNERVSIYAAQPWNATILMPANGTITARYRYPGGAWDDELEEYVYYYDDTVPEDGYRTASKTFIVNTIDKTAPVPTVTYVYADTGEEVGDVTETTREIRADVTADEPIEGVEGGLSCTFSYGTAQGATQTFSVHDRAGNAAEITAVCPATISVPAPAAENQAPTATVYVSANLGGTARSIGTFTLSENGEITTYADGEASGQTVNRNNETVAAINAAIAENIATFYTLRFEIRDEAPAACTVTSSDRTVAEVGANNTVTVRKNGTFTLSVSDNDNKVSSLVNLTVASLDTEAPTVTPVYGLYTAGDGSQRVRVAFKPENDEQIYPIVTGDKSSRNILSTLYNLYDADGTTVLDQRTGFFIDFEKNEDYTFYYKDAFGNSSSVSVQIRGIDTDAPAFTSIKWQGTVNNMTPETEGAGPTAKNVIATLKTDKPLSAAELRYYAKDAENHVGEPLSAEDAKKVSVSCSTNLVEVTWTDNVTSALVLLAKSAANAQTAFYELPALNVIDRTDPTVNLNGTPRLLEDKSGKEFRFTVSGAEGELFTSNLACVYTAVTENDKETVTRYAIGTKGTEFIYTARSSVPVTLRFVDDAGNSTEYLLTDAMLADIDTMTLSVSFNTAASEQGATRNLAELALHGDTVYVYSNKDATLTLIDDPQNNPVDAEPDPSKVWQITARTWTPVTVSMTADIQLLRFVDANTGGMTYAWLVSDADRVPPAISYTGEDTVFATTEMTLSQIQQRLLSDVSAFDGVDGSIDKGTISVTGCSTVAGLHTVTYTAQDAAGNEAALERSLYVKGQYDPIVQINGKDTVPLGTTVVHTKDISVTASCALRGDNSVFLEIRPGVMTAARMKYSTAIGTNSLLYTAPKDGYYTVLARNRDRTELLTYIYVEESK